MSRNHYQPQEYGQFVKVELVKAIANDPNANDWLDLMTRQIAAQNQGIRDFGVVGAMELVVSALAKGVYTPKDEYMRGFMADFHSTKERG